MEKLKIALWAVALLASAAYILNPTAGVFEPLPDNLPFVGNLDEAAAAALLLQSIRRLRALRRQRPVS